jgi:ribonuclease VapC
MVLAGARGTAEVWGPLDEFIAKAAIEVVPFDGDQMRRSREAFLRFGKGRDPAALNLGDCAAYALASARGMPLLFKGQDFAKTDVKAALSEP